MNQIPKSDERDMEIYETAKSDDGIAKWPKTALASTQCPVKQPMMRCRNVVPRARPSEVNHSIAQSVQPRP